MGGVQVAVQEADADRGDAAGRQVPGGGGDRLLVEGPDDRAGGVQALGDLADQVEGTMRSGLTQK